MFIHQTVRRNRSEFKIKMQKYANTITCRNINSIQRWNSYIFSNIATLYYAIREITSRTFRVNNIAIFDNIIMARLFRSKRTSKILNLIYNTLTDRHRTNSSSINILLIPFLQNFTKGYSLPRTLAYPIHLFLINNRLN